ncbi:transposase [Membranicola marinus]|uniref:Transposase n=1 Tax=Membranihabitans marinus TaxID=1227546 RepID=A0A953HNM4_9BACT|nr:transposase [Membranihabitans marinus]MBY5957893.1 transposase [Membranihabitans marinus]
MANKYLKIYIQIIFAVKYREAILAKSWRSELFSYMSTSLLDRGNYPLAVNGSYDHVHLFFDYRDTELISDLVRELKKSSNSFIKNKGFTRSKFQWQTGYGAFSYSYREKGKIIEYIRNQEKHHQKVRLKDEYLSMLNDFEIDFKDEYLFDFLE